jgi:hypothetical protein
LALAAGEADLKRIARADCGHARADSAAASRNGGDHEHHGAHCKSEHAEEDPSAQRTQET